MKKTYTKPQIMFESFTLSTNIASDCEHQTNTPSSRQCGIDASGLGTIFLEQMSGCSFKAMLDPDYPGDGYWGATGSGPDAICYHVPYGSNLFNS